MRPFVQVLQIIILVNVCGCTAGSSSEQAAKAGAKPDAGKSQATKTTCLAIVNGHPTPAYPAVRALQSVDGACTATFVSPSTAITAAHCVDDTETGGVYVESKSGEKIDATKVITLGLTKSDEDQLIKIIQGVKDVAVVIFPDGTSPEYLPVAAKAAANDDMVTMVGVGLTDPNDKASNSNHVKYVGTNKVTDIHNGYVFSWVGDGAGGDRAAVSNGDSGGPLLIGGALAGVAHGAGEVAVEDVDGSVDLSQAGRIAYVKASAGGPIFLSVHLNLGTPAMKAFLRNAESEGAHIEYQTAQKAASQGAATDDVCAP